MVAAIEKFLDEQERSPSSRTKRVIAPIIERLKLWRQTNNLSQSQAVEILLAAGLPARIRTLQDWKIGRRSPRALAASALERFLDEHLTITYPVWTTEGFWSQLLLLLAHGRIGQLLSL